MQSSIHERIKTLNAIHPAALRTNGTVNGPSIDKSDAEAVEFILSAGAYTDGTHTMTLEESEDNGSGSPASWGAVASGDFKGTAVVSAAGNANKTQRIAYLGSKRWVRAVLVTSGATTGAYVAASCVLTHLRDSALSGQA